MTLEGDSMAILRVERGGALHGDVRVPGDKSVSHRSLLLNTLASGPARIDNLLDAADVRATAAACEALGARIEHDGESVVLTPPDRLREPQDVIDCGNSGTSMRLLAGVLAAEPFFSVLTGDASLRGRPMGRVARPLVAMGARIAGRSEGALAPLAIQGPLSTDALVYDSPIASAQVKSALLLAGRRTGIRVREPRQSRDHTERMLRAMGADLVREPSGFLRLAPVSTLRALDVVVPGDVSSAAFWMVAASLVPGSSVRLQGVGLNPTRTGVIDALRAMGAQITVEQAEQAPRGEPQADLLITHAPLQGARIDGELALRALDELPVLAVAAAFASGPTVIADAAELRVKESDRLARTAAGLRALGASVEERPDGLAIPGGLVRPRGDAPAVIDCTGDHRIAMAFAIAGLRAGPVDLVGADVSTSYPRFFQDLEALRA